MIRVGDLKKLTGNPKLLRVNAIKINNQWVEIVNGQPQPISNFNGFSFNPSTGNFRDTIIYLSHPDFRDRLFTIAFDVEKIQNFNLESVCSSPKTLMTTTTTATTTACPTVTCPTATCPTVVMTASTTTTTSTTTPTPIKNDFSKIHKCGGSAETNAEIWKRLFKHITTPEIINSVGESCVTSCKAETDCDFVAFTNTKCFLGSFKTSIMDTNGAIAAFVNTISSMTKIKTRFRVSQTKAMDLFRKDLYNYHSSYLEAKAFEGYDSFDDSNPNECAARCALACDGICNFFETSSNKCIMGRFDDDKSLAYGKPTGTPGAADSRVLNFDHYPVQTKNPNKMVSSVMVLKTYSKSSL